MQPTHVSTLPGTTDMVTPIAKSTPVTQASHMPVLLTVPSNQRDILEPMSSEQARYAYLERQMQGMSSVRLPLDMPSLEDISRDLQTCQKEYKPFVKSRRRKESMSGDLLKWL